MPARSAVSRQSTPTPPAYAHAFSNPTVGAVTFGDPIDLGDDECCYEVQTTLTEFGALRLTVTRVFEGGRVAGVYRCDCGTLTFEHSTEIAEAAALLVRALQQVPALMAARDALQCASAHDA